MSTSLHLKVSRPKIVITTGEPTGVGPDLVCQIFAEGHLPPADYWVLGDRAVLMARAQRLGLQGFQIQETSAPALSVPGVLPLKPMKALISKQLIEAGQPSSVTAHHVFDQLHEALDLCREGQAAWVTGPIDQSIQASVDPSFRGHTDYLAKHTKTTHVTMMMLSPACRVALVTTHIPFQHVISALTPERIERTVDHTHKALQAYWGIDSPKLGLLALNPHAGDFGLIGTEELSLLQPLAIRLKSYGYDCSLPLPPDSAFIPENRMKYDAFIALYHDQGLIPIKALSFDTAVNATLNLPFVRTSVDHGTGYALAGTGKASNKSLRAAIQYAFDFQKARQSTQLPRGML